MLLPTFFSIRDCSPSKYYKNVKKMISFNLKKNENCKIYLIAIADPGNILKKKIYHIKEDVDYYNKILMQIANEYKSCIYVDWKKEHSADEYTLESDGHHLNSYGNRLLLDNLLQIIGEGKK